MVGNAGRRQWSPQGLGERRLQSPQVSGIKDQALGEVDKESGKRREGGADHGGYVFGGRFNLIADPAGTEHKDGECFC